MQSIRYCQDTHKERQWLDYTQDVVQVEDASHETYTILIRSTSSENYAKANRC